MVLLEAHFTRRELAGAVLGGVALGSAPRAASAELPVPKEGYMRLGIVTYNVAKDWNLATILRISREIGIQGVEFRTTHAHGVEPVLDATARATVRSQCQDAGLVQTSLGTVCEFHSPDPAVVRQNVATCRDFLNLAKDIGAKGVKVRPNGLPREVPEEKTLEQIGRALAEAGKTAADLGVEIWLEVHGGGTSLPPNCRKIMDHCGHPSVGITWNSNGTDITEGSVKPGFDLLRPFIKCVHINDLWGSYPYRELFRLLKESGYAGFTLCEVGAAVRPEDGAVFLKCYQGLWRELQR